MQVIKEVNAKGFYCPTPLAIVSKELKEIPVGEKIKVVANDKAFKQDIKMWCLETGNKLISFEEKDGEYVAVIERGKGFHGEGLVEKIKFIALGVKLHILQYLLEILPNKKPKYLISFVSIAEGLRADKWLKEKGIQNYVMLPVPDEIYEYCGLVYGFKKKEDALNVYKLLKENKFGVESIHKVEKSNYPIVEID